MFDKKGKSTIAIVLTTMIVTILFCYVVNKVSEYVSILKYGNYNFGSMSSLAKSGDTKLLKVGITKAIIDNSYLNEYDENELIDATIEGMLEGLDDPYAAYYNESAFESFYTQTEGEYEGIGVYISYDTNKKLPIIITPIVGSPAAEVGLLPGDYISYVDDIQASTVNYDELVDAIKGKVGTKVKIGIQRFKEDESFEDLEYEVERRKIDINPITQNVYEGNIGYIKITSFDEVSYKEFNDMYQDLINNKKISGLIIDLRNNSGGLFDECIKIADVLVPSGKIVYTIDKSGKEEASYSKAGHIEIPLAVLVNEGSASASEVLTAAIKDYGVGKIIGEKTYGKGVVQTLKSLGDGTYIKLTTAEYFSPNGNKINGLGIAPDIVVELPEDIENYYAPDFEDDTQLQKAIEEVKNMLKNDI